MELVSYLLSKGASIHTKNSRGDTPLSLAVYMGHDEVVDVLLPRLGLVRVRVRFRDGLGLGLGLSNVLLSRLNS